MAYRAKLIIAYLGTDFAGWQRQDNAATVQGEIEAAFTAMTRGLETWVVGAGRTDAGVHARGQTAHLEVPSGMEPEDLKRGLNQALPPAIRVRRAVRVAPGFHARHDALGKHYAYRARWRPSDLPWQGLRTAAMRAVSRGEHLEKALELLPGRRDMASFSVPDPSQGPTVKLLSRVWSRPTRDGLELHFVGSGFLRYQVRRMVGVLLQVGWGQLEVADVAALLAHPEPGAGIYSAPANGLTMERVWYRPTPLLRSERRD